MRDVSYSLNLIGELEKAEGNLGNARNIFAEDLEIIRKIADQLNTPKSYRDVSISLIKIGNIEVARLNLDCARKLFSDSLEIRRKLSEQLNTLDSLLGVLV